MAADLRPDPGGIFDSDMHRRVLGHLSTPDADHGWAPVPLLLRLNPDPHTPVPPVGKHGLADIDAGLERLEEILADLKSDGYAQSYKGDVWRMTKKGFDALTGSIANEPPPDAEPEGPAMVLGPTPIGS